jgi:organic radical activating enzyme
MGVIVIWSWPEILLKKTSSQVWNYEMTFKGRVICFFLISVFLVMIVDWTQAGTVVLKTRSDQNTLFYKLKDDTSGSGSGDDDQQQQDQSIEFEEVIGIGKNRTLTMELDGILPLIHSHFYPSTNGTSGVLSQEQHRQLLESISTMDQMALFDLVLQLLKKDATEGKFAGVVGKKGSQSVVAYPIRVQKASPATDWEEYFLPSEHLNKNDLVLEGDALNHFRNTLLMQLIEDTRQHFIYQDQRDGLVDEQIASESGDDKKKVFHHLLSQMDESPTCEACLGGNPAAGKNLMNFIKDVGSLVGYFSKYHELWKDTGIQYEKLLRTPEDQLAEPLKKMKHLLMKARERKLLCEYMLEKNYVVRSVLDTDTSLNGKLNELLREYHQSTSTTTGTVYASTTPLMETVCAFQNDVQDWKNLVSQLSPTEKQWLTSSSDPSAPSAPQQQQSPGSNPTGSSSSSSSRSPSHVPYSYDSSDSDYSDYSDYDDEPKKSSDTEEKTSSEEVSLRNKENVSRPAPIPVAIPTPIFYPNLYQPTPYLDPLYFDPNYGLWSLFSGGFYITPF